MNIELVTLIKNQVIEAIKREYFLVKKTNNFNNVDPVKGDTFLMYATDLVCDYFVIDKSLVMSKSQINTCIRVRQAIIVICRDVCKSPIPYKQMGKFFGRNHAAIIHAYKQAVNSSSVDKVYKHDLDTLKNMARKNFIENKPVENLQLVENLEEVAC